MKADFKTTVKEAQFSQRNRAASHIVGKCYTME